MPVNVSINGKSGPFPPGTALFDAAESLGSRPHSSCGRNGKCRECLLEVQGGGELLNARTAAEAHLSGGFRLSCCARLEADAGEVGLKSPSRGTLRISSAGVNLPATVAATPLDPAVTRAGNRILLEGREIAVAAGPLYGVAVDLGTTTVVLRVYDLETKEPVAGAAFENPQRFAGSDIMARIAYDTRHGGKLLQRVVLNEMARVLEALPVKAECIYEMVLAGNSAMRDLFFGLNVESIGQKPYRSLTEVGYREGRAPSTSISTTAKKLRLPLHPAARIYGLPLIGSHVGADAAACLLALDLDRRDTLAALMDIGTNTEVACGNRGQLYVASCPAGPAFEGGTIRCGMPGWDGAIERVRLNGSDRHEYSVIGGGEPAGICGSGLVDTLSELRRTGRMDEYGRLTNEESKFAIDRLGKVCLHESDIGELAQAKGANAAGLQILLKQQGISLDQVDKLYLAGGFASHLDVAASRNIGLVPHLPDGRIVPVGNAAIEGAAIALISMARRADLERYVRTAKHVELETDPDFFNHFVEGCLFNPYRSTA